MNWDAIAAIAEVVGALAVLITLAYLAIQTRDNVKIMRSRAIWDAQVSFVEVNELLADDGAQAWSMGRQKLPRNRFSPPPESGIRRFSLKLSRRSDSGNGLSFW